MYKKQWDEFVKEAKNGTFLFQRDFMEYHSDRFLDYSLLIYEKNKLIALLPANKKGQKIYSHQGLTYGGLLFKDSVGGEKVKRILDEVLLFLQEQGITNLYVKMIPVFYHKEPSLELSFFLPEKGGVCYSKDLNLAIDYRLPWKLHKSKRKNFNKRESLGFQIEEMDDCEEFWQQVLIPRLKEKHQVAPVHSLEEIHFLKKKFPSNIKQYNISLNNQVLAGITIFKTDTVVKSQYGAVTNEGEKYRALDFLFITLIQKYKDEGYTFFDMGTVTENNFGLLKQKEELGCRIYTQDFYKLELV